MKRELARLVRRLIEIASAIKNSVESISKNQHSDDDKSKPPSQSDINAHVTLPVSVTDYYAAENRDGPWKIRRDQWRLAVESATLIAVIIAAVFAYRGFCETRKQAAAAQEQVGIMRKQLEAADRPWIKIAIVPSHDITYTALGEGQFYFTAIMKNIGHSVATDVAIKFAVLVPKGNGVFTEPIERQRKICGTPQQSTIKDTDHDLRTSIFPGDTSDPLNFGTNIPSTEINDGALHFPPDAQGRTVEGTFFSPYLVGCVDYTFATSAVRHQTGFIYNIARVDPKRDVHPLAFKVGAIVPRTQVILEKYIFGGDYKY